MPDIASSAAPTATLDHALNAADILAHAVRQYPDDAAYTQFGVTITYHEFDEASARLAAWLTRDLGLEPGDRLAIMLPNMIQFPITVFAGLRAGLVLVPLNPLHTAPELVPLLADAEPRAVVVFEPFAATLETAMHDVPVEHVLIARVGDMQPFPKNLVADASAARKHLAPSYSLPRSVPFRTALRRRRPADFEAPAIDGEMLAFLHYTDVASGTSNGAMLGHADVLAQVIAFGEHILGDRLDEPDRTLIALPLHHVSAFVTQCMVAVWQGAHARLVVNPGEIDALVADWEDHSPHQFTGPNTLLAALLDNERFRRLDFSDLYLSGTGGAPIQPDAAERWRVVTGRPVVEVYGLTEGRGAVNVRAGPPHGRVP